ncbi:MAG: class I SAM-dependent methyltransferase [Thermoleophilia bacterium]|nr:class I SAM-dependent methyltransferase [Thermoleophilia bacterium]
MPGLPPLVRRAVALAEGLGFDRSCSVETGRLLHTLAAQRGRARVGEIGTGCGVGAAWIVSALPPAARFVTVEVDERLAAAATHLFADDEHVGVLCGDWEHTLPPHAPFELLFVDARPAKAHAAVPGLLAPGGTAVLDDLRPGERMSYGVRELWLEHPDLVAVELTVRPEESVILAVRAL